MKITIEEQELKEMISKAEETGKKTGYYAGYEDAIKHFEAVMKKLREDKDGKKQ